MIYIYIKYNKFKNFLMLIFFKRNDIIHINNYLYVYMYDDIFNKRFFVIKKHSKEVIYMPSQNIQKYKMQGLTCANCTQKIVSTIKEWNGICDASFNFASQVLTLKTAKDEDLTKKIQNKINSIEEGVYVSKINEESILKEKSFKKNNSQLFRLYRIVIGFLGILLLFILNKYELMDEKFQGIVGLFIYFPVAFSVLKKTIKNIIRLQPFDENFLMGLATIGAITLGEIHEALAVIVFYELGEYLQEKAVNKSRKNIMELLDKKVELSHVMRKDNYVDVSPGDLKKGDIILLKVGEMLACDSELISDNASFDTSSISGEHKKRDYRKGDFINAGFISVNNSCTLVVKNEYNNSTIKKIMNLSLESAGKKAKTEKLITRFASYYTPLVVIAAILIAVLGPFITGDLQSVWIYRALVFLVISCPCAIVLSIPLSFFAAIGRLSREGILLKGANFIEKLNNVGAVIFDKTGTITEGDFKVIGIEALYDYSEEDIVLIAKELEKHSTHPIANAIIKYADENIPNEDNFIFKNKYLLEKNIIEQSGEGLSAFFDSKEIRVGKKTFCSDVDESFNLEKDYLGTSVYVAIDKKIIGMILLGDKIKPGIKELIKNLKEKNIKTSILTGDDKNYAYNIAKILEVDNVHGELLPEDKLQKLNEIMENTDGFLVYVGDGINDAPVLARADIGISMGEKGSDIAVETSDVVIMNDDTSSIEKLFKISHKTILTVKENIVFALFVKFLFFSLAILGISSMWFAVFADVGVSLITVINSMRLTKKT